MIPNHWFDTRGVTVRIELLGYWIVFHCERHRLGIMWRQLAPKYSKYYDW